MEVDRSVGDLENYTDQLVARATAITVVLTETSDLLEHALEELDDVLFRERGRRDG